PRLRPGAAALPAALLARDLERLLYSAVGFEKVDLEVDLQIAAAARPAPAAAPPEQVAKQIAEQVHDLVGVVEVVRRDTVQPGIAITVVARPLLRIAQHLEGLGRLLELDVRLRIARIAIGVVLHRQRAVSLL